MRFAHAGFVELVRRAQSGDKTAFGQLLDSCGRRLYDDARALVGKRLRSLIDPADLIQATRIVLWQGLRAGKFQLDVPQKFLALARTILRRQAARIYRTLQPEFNATQTIDFNLGETLADVSFAASDKDRQPVQELDLNDAIERLLNGLDATDRELIRLRLLGYTTAAVAKMLDMPAGSLRVRLGRLRHRLMEFGALQQVLSN